MDGESCDQHCGDPERLFLYHLPNEILVSVLAAFETKALLPLVLVSRRFHSVVLRILHYRLLLAAASPEYKIILEAYHPSRKNTEPYLFCAYLGTDGLSSKLEGAGSLYEDCQGPEGRLAKLGSLYSRFRPESPGVEGMMPLRRIAGAAPPQSAPGTSQPIYANGGDGGSKKILHSINLDADELFGQFCAYGSLVKLGPRRGVFLSTVHIVKRGEGVIRVWREWLKDRARELREQEEDSAIIELERSSTDTPALVGEDKCILWTDYKRNVGLRVAIRDQQRRRTVNSRYTGEDIPMSFSVEIKELVVRTTHLMLAVEESMEEQKNRSGESYLSWSIR